MTTLWCLHGNLQLPSVWEPLRRKLESPHLQFKLENLNATKASGFEDWTKIFCEKVAAHPKENHVLLGYSLGGRLALHALLHCSSLWAGAIVVGADPGLKTEEGRTAQLERDRAWAARWLHEDWKSLWQSWDVQSVFAGRPNVGERLEENYSREQIAQLFEIFSKGHQADLRPQLATLHKPPIVYLSGEEDVKYSALGRELEELCPAFTHELVEDAAHRVPWENPEVFRQKVRAFLNQTGVEVQTI